MTNNSILNTLKWRYAVKKFDKNKKITDDKIETILEAGNLTATSLGLQPFKMVLIDDPELIVALKEVTFNQENIQTCSHLLVLCVATNVDDAYVENFIDYIAQTRKVERDTLLGYEKMCKTFINGLSQEHKEHWISHQAYIVLGNLLTTCAALEVDSCPMEGFNPPVMDEILQLKDQNLRSVLMLPMGYRAEDDVYAQMEKVRKPLKEMVIKISKA